VREHDEAHARPRVGNELAEVGLGLGFGFRLRRVQVFGLGSRRA
jgi:hypothetical protein